MKKSIYSLVLADAVIEGIDRMAYGMGISRSALINQILAERIDYITPEQRIAQVFEALENFVRHSGAYRIYAQPSSSMFSLTAPLTYKYNPTVKYSLELNKEYVQGKDVGVLRISLRSKSAALMECLNAFYLIWSALEKRSTGRCGTAYSDGRYAKPIRPIGNLTPEELGTAIADYIKVVDDCMGIFFSYLDSPARSAREIEARYLSYLNSKAKIM